MFDVLVHQMCLCLFHYISKENYVLFTPYISPGTQKYSLHFESRRGKWFNSHTYQENIPGHPTASNLADSLNTNALFVNYV
jgi:hypothetical protein